MGEIKAKRMNKSSFGKKILITIICLIFIVGAGCVIWTSKAYGPQQLAEKSLKSDENIRVENGDYITFTPTNVEVTKGFIFYPGGGVKPEAYAPLCREIANDGYKVVIAKMPLNLAVLSPNKADEIIEKYDNIQYWAIGGHSLGGVMASKYASSHDNIKGVALYASYPSGDELKNKALEVVSIFGDKDGVVNKSNLKKSEGSLPEDTEFIEIDGGNHSQFGDYGLQKGDNKATISTKDQILSTADYTVQLLDKIN